MTGHKELMCLRLNHARAFCVFRGMILLILLAFVFAASAGAVVYVDISATGAENGNDWTNAYTTIQAGIDEAFGLGGDEVWVADGVYPENLVLKNGVRVYGGFVGGEATLDERNFVDNIAAVDGGEAGSCLTAIGVTSGAFNGLTLTNGSGYIRTVAPIGVYGGGAYIESCPATMTIENCKFIFNTANYGGGIALLSSASPQIIHCTITENAATGSRGGGIYLGSQCSPFINTSTISYNTAMLGAGMYIYDHSSPNIQANLIVYNSSTSHGGGFYLNNYCNPYIEGNTIDHNTAVGSGAGIRAYDHCSPRIENNAITFNTASGVSYGGGISFNYYGQFEIVNNVIMNNKAQYGAGIAVRDRSDGEIVTNMIRLNTATEGGGAIYMDSQYSDVNILNNTIRANKATHGGGGIRLHGGAHPLIANNMFLANAGGDSGGGVMCDASAPDIVNCTFVAGMAAASGGIYCNSESDISITNSIFSSNNSSGGFGSAVWAEDTSTPDDPKPPVVTFTQYNLVYDYGMWPFFGISPSGYIDADPLFVNPGKSDYHLDLFSPAADKGNSSAVTADMITLGDIDGEPRISDAHVGIGAVVDLGCDEIYIETATPDSGFINAGWNWISIPIQPLDPNASAVFGAANVVNKLFMWDKVRKSVLLYPSDFTDVVLGEGYMVQSNVTQSPSYLGLAYHGEVVIPLPDAGLAWIGHPHNSPVKLSSLKVYNEITEETRTVAEDVAAREDAWINWHLIYWNPYRDSAMILYLGGGDDDTLRPWYSYRIWANTGSLQLIIPEE